MEWYVSMYNIIIINKNYWECFKESWYMVNEKFMIVFVCECCVF